MNPKDSNRLRDKIIEILQVNCTDNTGTDVRPLYPLLHFFEDELHEYGKTLQGKVLDLTHELDDAKYELETLRGQIVDRDLELKEGRENLIAMTLERDEYDQANRDQAFTIKAQAKELEQAYTRVSDLDDELTASNRRNETIIQDWTKESNAQKATIERLESELTEAVEIMGAIYDNVDKYHLDFAFSGGECYEKLKEYLGV